MKMKFENRGINWKGVLTLAALSVGIVEATAAVPLEALPDMSQLTQFATFGGNFNLNLATVNGPAGISPDGIIAISAPSAVDGDLFLATGATKTGPGKVTGLIFSGSDFYGDVDLPEAQIEVFAASSTFLSIPADTTLNGKVNGPRTFGTTDGVADVQVFTINGDLSLSGSQGITFVGDPGDVFVLNITGVLSMTGSAAIGTPDQAATVIVNLTSSRGLGTAAHIDNVINGTILVPNASSVTFHSANGAIYGGFGKITLMSGAEVNFVPFAPEPPTDIPPGT